MIKSEMLFAANYRYNFDRDLYVNPQKKKAFSIEFIGDNRQEEIARLLEEDTNGTGWTFYFNQAPSEGVKRELELNLESVYE